MQLMSRLSVYLFTLFALSVCSMHAQEDDEDEEEFGHMGFFNRSTESVTVGVKLTQSAKVHFGELGTVPSNVALPSSGETNRIYNDGYVLLDKKRTSGRQSEDSTLGQFQVSTSGNPPGRRYIVTGDDPANNVTDGVIVGDYISHTPGYTRDWGYRNISQINPPSHLGYIAFHNYSADTQHASAEGNRGYSNGIDLTLTHLLYRANKRVSFSLVAGMSLTGINSMHAGTVKSSLHVVTDLFLLNSIQPELPLATGGYYGTSITTTNGVDYENGQLISNLPDPASGVEDDADGATVDGIWKVKGAYFTFKFGPQITALITPSFGFSASIGATGSYVGTTYSAAESFTVDGIPNKISYNNSSSKNTFMPGYYANLDATWTLNGRTGFFAGFSYENLGVVSQRLAGRTAKIDLNNTAGFRGGLNIKF